MGSSPVSKFQASAGSSLPKVVLGLQGGGTHGAFTWGVLDRLFPEFEKRGIPVVGISGDSAGAMNTLYASYGLITGKRGRKSATASFMLERLWWSVDRMAFMARQAQSLQNFSNPATAMAEVFEQAGHLMNLPKTAVNFMHQSSRHPVLRFNGFKIPPLQQMVEQHIDFKRFMDPDAPAVMINTTDKHNGRPKLYLNSALAPQAAAESGYLPRIFLRMFGADHPSHKTHDHDGGFTANPPVKPLYEHCPQATDLVVVRITPLVQDRAVFTRMDPDKAMADQQLRYLYNSAVEAELRDLKGRAESDKRKFNLHVISVPSDWNHPMDTQASLKHTSWEFFQELRAAGHKAADRWLAEEGHHFGRQSTYNVGYEVFGHAAGAKPAHKFRPANG